MSVVSGRRQFELDAAGLLRRSKGISVRHQVNFDARENESGLYTLDPDELAPGQYAFFLYIAAPERARSGGNTGGEPLRGFVFDFQVE